MLADGTAAWRTANIALGYSVWPHAWRELANKLDKSHNEERKQTSEG
jgi:hypothetical protein